MLTAISIDDKHLKEMNMTKVARSRMRDQTYRIIRERILNQHYRFGERINIDILSRELGVSNNPIREALTVLEQDGIITITPNVGAKVLEFTAESYRELTETIEILLVGGYELCRREERVPELITAMQEALVKQEEALTQEGEVLDLARHAMVFDECFVRVSGNQCLMGVYDKLVDRFLLAFIHDYTYRDFDKTRNFLEHQDILAAITMEDHERVLSMIKQHYGKSIAKN